MSAPCLSELLEEADVIGEHLAEVLDAVAFLGHSVDAEAEREPAPLLGIDPAGRRTLGWTMPHPPSSTHSPSGRADVELGRWLGEREVAGPQARCEALAEERFRERLDRAGEVAEVMSRSMTRPSIWWNTGMCVASGVSRRNTRPGR